MSLILVLVFECSWFKPEFTIRFVVDSLEQAEGIVRHHKKSSKAKLKMAYVTEVFDVD